MSGRRAEPEAAVEQAAQRIAAGGREALVARLRRAYAQAAAKHADVVNLGPDRIEELVQRSADRADGLQWRRALADVACEELGIGLLDAVGHPAVARAHELVGAPAYEDGPGRPRRERFPRVAPPDSEDAAADRVEDAAADEVKDEDDGEVEEAPELHLTAVHRGGVANLPTDEGTLELRISEAGLDIRAEPDALIGRLGWNEITELQAPVARGPKRRRPGGSRLVVRTRQGDASFDVEGLSREELRARLQPLVSRYGA